MKKIQDELARSREALLDQKIVNPSFITFCYPNGNYTERIAGMVKDAGYHAAVTTNHGWSHRDADPFQLRRIGIHQDMNIHYGNVWVQDYWCSVSLRFRH